MIQWIKTDMLQLKTILKVLYPADVVLLKVENIFSFTFLDVTRKLLPILNTIFLYDLIFPL